jgi:glycosyltransferase involved in cell wall biosynthesis
MPKFSVVIPVYNKANYLPKTLASVLSQTEGDFEVVLVDDGSSDGSKEVIAQFNDARIRYYFQENQGVSTARNTAIRQAEGDYIALLDADDVWHPTYLETHASLIEQFPSQQVFAVNSVYIKGDRHISKRYSIEIGNLPRIVDFFEASLRHSIVCSSTTVFHSSVIDTVGYYDSSIESGEDTDFFIRLGLHFPIVFSPKVLADIIVAQDSLSQQSLQKVRTTHFSKFGTLEKTQPLLKKYLDLNRYSLCIQAILENDTATYQQLLAKIDLNQLSQRQRFLLQQNRGTLKFFLKAKEMLSQWGLQLSSFQ